MQAFKFFSRMKNNCLIITSFILIVISEMYLINDNFKFSASFITTAMFDWITSFNFNAMWYNITLISVLLFNKLCMIFLSMFIWYFKISMIHKIFNSELSSSLSIAVNKIWMISSLSMFSCSFEDKFWNIIL